MHGNFIVARENPLKLVFSVIVQNKDVDIFVVGINNPVLFHALSLIQFKLFFYVTLNLFGGNNFDNKIRGTEAAAD
mgnify:CR=1 FL=1